MPYHQPSPSDDSEFENSEMQPLIEITCPADFHTAFKAQLNGKELDVHITQFITNMLPEELVKVAEIIPAVFHECQLNKAPTTKDAFEFFKTARAVLKGLYRESGDVEDVPHLLKLSEFIFDLGEVIENKLEASIYLHDNFFLERLKYTDRILTDMLEDLPSLEALKPCIEIYRSTPGHLQCETLYTISKCVDIYARSGKLSEALLCADWLTDALHDLRHDKCRLFREGEVIPKHPARMSKAWDKLVWRGSRQTLLSCADVYEKTHQPKLAVKSYTVLAEICSPIFFKSEESFNLCLADILNKRAHAGYEACSYAASKHDARRALELVEDIGDVAAHIRKSAKAILDESPIDPSGPSTDNWGYNSSWSPDGEDDGGLLG